jgi:hypothetical protein
MYGQDRHRLGCLTVPDGSWSDDHFAVGASPLIPAIGALLMLSPVATADINALARVQWHTSNPEGTVRLGHDQCDMMTDYGWSPRQVANNPAWAVVPPGSQGALAFIKTAITYYCPQYLSEVDW